MCIRDSFWNGRRRCCCSVHSSHHFDCYCADACAWPTARLWPRRGVVRRVVRIVGMLLWLWTAAVVVKRARRYQIAQCPERVGRRHPCVGAIDLLPWPLCGTRRCLGRSTLSPIPFPTFSLSIFKIVLVVFLGEIPGQGRRVVTTHLKNSCCPSD